MVYIQNTVILPRGCVCRLGEAQSICRAPEEIQVFAFNHFLPFREGNGARLSERVCEAIGIGISIDEVGFEWVPPSALLGEIDGGRAVGNEPATAVDVSLRGHLRAGRRAVVLLELKLSEPDFTHCGGRDSPGNDKKHVCASAARFLENPNKCYLRRPQRRQRDRRYWEYLHLKAWQRSSCLSRRRFRRAMSFRLQHPTANEKSRHCKGP